jgi:hypothetical protein
MGYTNGHGDPELSVPPQLPTAPSAHIDPSAHFDPIIVQAPSSTLCLTSLGNDLFRWGVKKGIGAPKC